MHFIYCIKQNIYNKIKTTQLQETGGEVMVIKPYAVLKLNLTPVY